jgi:hypothetical protein
MSKKKAEKRGGKRKNAGRKKLYNEETKTVSFALPKSRIEEIKQHVKTKLSNYKTNQK